MLSFKKKKKKKKSHLYSLPTPSSRFGEDSRDFSVDFEGDGVRVEEPPPGVRQHVRLLPGATAELPEAEEAVQDAPGRDLPQDP